MKSNYKQTSIGKIPKEWEVVKTKNICELERGRVISHKENIGFEFLSY